MDQTYDFSESFQAKLLGLIYAGIVTPTIVHPTYFQNPIYSEICDSIITLRQEYSSLTREMLETHILQKKMFRDREYRLELQEIIPMLFKSGKKSENSYIYNLAFQFAKLQQYRNFFRKGVEILQEESTESLGQIESLFADISFLSQTQDEIGDFYFSSLPERLKKRNQVPNVLRTLIPPLDKCLADGGFSRGELVVFAGLASVGKSFSLLHMATAGLLQMKKVVYYSLEMENYKIATRLDAAFAGVFTHDIRDHGETIEKRLHSLMKQFGDNLLIKRMPAGNTRVSDLKSHLDMLKFRGFVPDVVIVDYINLMRPESATREGRHRDLGEVYIALKGLGQERNLHPITAAQSNRTGFNAPLITIAHFADTFEGGMHADTIITINRDDDEAEQEKVRLYVAKDRDGVDKKIIKGYTNYKKGSFWSRKHQRGV